ncbi:MAG: FAD-dependent oxidoreductase [Burkholderiales bacterium]
MGDDGDPRISTTQAPSIVACDVLVVGAGAGGLATAITARLSGLEVIVVEKEAQFGGTTALSGGWIWVPCSHHARAAGVDDSPAAARRYLEHELGQRFDPARVDTYLQNAPEMVEFFERHTAVRFQLGREYPDYHPSQPGGASGGRALCPVPFDGRELGERLEWLRPPVREMTLYGLKVGSGPDFHHFFNARRSPRSAWYVARRVARHMTDVARHGRDVLLMSGNALMARLGKTVFDLDIPLWLATPARELLVEGAVVVGARITREGRPVEVRARRGVVLAAGGFARDQERRRVLFPHAPNPGEHHSLTGPGNTGDGLRMAEAVGAAIESSCVSAAPWMPVSEVRYADGTFGVYPHSYERGKPGAILVGPDGRRFCNESDSYHDVVQAMIARRRPGTAPHAYLVADARFLRRYGLGMAKPFPLPLRPYLRSGYLRRARTLEGLASAIGVDASALVETVTRFNRHAARGEDPEFNRGANAYNRYQGDLAQRPNPCLAPIDEPPFYAVRVLPGDLGTFMGLRTNELGNVLDRDGHPVGGLFAVGNDMASLFGGHYPGPGSNIGPAMTFGFVCARHLAAAATPP